MSNITFYVTVLVSSYTVPTCQSRDSAHSPGWGLQPGAGCRNQLFLRSFYSHQELKKVKSRSRHSVKFRCHQQTKSQLSAFLDLSSADSNISNPAFNFSKTLKSDTSMNSSSSSNYHAFSFADSEAWSTLLSPALAGSASSLSPTSRTSSTPRTT